MDPGLRRIPALLLSAALAGCGGSPPAPPPAAEEALRLTPPPTGRGALYVYRSSWLAAAWPIEATAAGAAVRLAPGTFARIESPPGKLEVGCRLAERTASAAVVLAEGEIRFVELAAVFGWWMPGCAADPVAPERGRAAIAAGRPLAPQ